MYLLYSRKRTYILMISIAVIIGLLIPFSFAKKDVVENLTIKEENLTTTYESNKNQITQTLKVENKETSAQFYYTLKNTSLDEINYVAKIKFDKEIDHGIKPFIKVKIGEEETYLPNGIDNEYIIYSEKLKPKVADTNYISIYLANEDKIGNEIKKGTTLKISYKLTFTESDEIHQLTKRIENNEKEVYQDIYKNYRFYGSNPNNYVSFNNELWRIIGTEKIDSEIVTKIVRNDYIAKMPFSENDTNNFVKSQLLLVLNKTYLNQEKTDYNKVTYDFTSTGINKEYKDMIYQTNIRQSGDYKTDISSNLIYENEANTKKSLEKFSVTIMESSDYGFASGPSFNSTYLSKFSKTPIKSNYLFKKESEFLLNNNTSDYKEVFSISNIGNVVISKATSSLNIRPALYLKSDILITEGKGTLENPYKISL